ncbi:hypothetical protein CBR_g74668 [Chara braunii]|uniref:CCHC-type domain-containing protein n=1 Tax=Chara braunii TaxID=69332 RepID=A0A388KA92_CHABU|nr:hypothetical protein CBR_g74668 [Chara braunii]|eukprot:GBG66982.1 hypothetical protein CBR_g74668 [Chara braunii]
MGSNYRYHGRDNHRDWSGDRGRDYGSHNGGRDQHSEGRRERPIERGNSSQSGPREAPNRIAPVCYECGEPGHYQNQCPRLGRDGGPRYARQRGRSLSPRQHFRHPEPRVVSEDPTVKRQIEELAASMAAMKEAYDAEIAAKEAKKKKQEKLERKKREEEEAKAAEEARLAERRRIARKEEKLQKEEEDRRLLRKELLTEFSLRMGQLDESLQRRYERDLRERMKGKQKARAASSDDEDARSYESDVDILSRKTEWLVITNKRKRSAEKVVDDNPPMETPAKRTAKRRLQLGCRHQPMKKTSPLKTPRRTSGTGKRKLAGLSKMQAILAIVEKRTQIVAYGDVEARRPEEETGENPVEKEEVEEDEAGSNV